MRADRQYEDALVQAVVDGAEVEIPQAMIDAEAEDMAKEFEYRLSYQGIKLSDYLGYINMTRDQLLDEYKEQAAKSVKVRLVMEEIVKQEEMKFEQEELDAKIAEMAERSGQDVDTFKKGLGKEHYDYLANQILSDKLLAMLREQNAPAKKAAAKKSADAADGADAEKKSAEKKPAAKKAAPKKAAAADGEAKPAKKSAKKSEDSAE